MPRLTARDLLELTPELIGELSRADLERTALLVVELALDQANRLGRTSDTSSQPPSTDDPYRRQERREQSRPERQTDRGDGDDGQRPAGEALLDGAASQEGAESKVPTKPPGKQPGMPGYSSRSREWSIMIRRTASAAARR